MSRLVLLHRPASLLAAALSALVLLAACATAGAPSGTPSASPSPAPSPTSAVTPTPSLPPTTASPAPTATQSPAIWSNLVWTEVDKTFVFGLTEISAWSDGYVGIGHEWDADDQVSTAFFASDDGLTWRLVQRLAPGEELVPIRLLATDDGLLAMISGPAGRVDPSLWHSADGRIWQELSSPAWQAVWTADRYLVDLAGGPAGLVALVGSPIGPLALFSADGGRGWQATSLAAGAGAEARSVVATEHGFVAVGVVDGQRDPDLGVLNGHAAAWTSPDGRSWQAAEVEPAADADRLTFTRVSAAAEGLLAMAADTTGSIPGLPAQAWASADGHRWHPLGVLGTVVPRGALAGDGIRMLILDPGDWSPFSETPWPGYGSGWTSLDGRAWTPVTFTGQLMDQESWDDWWLTRKGLILSGTDKVWLAMAR